MKQTVLSTALLFTAIVAHAQHVAVHGTVLSKSGGEPFVGAPVICEAIQNVTWSEGSLYDNGDDFYLASQDLVNAFRTDENGLSYLVGAPDKQNVDKDGDLYKE